jgi:hypothetical protein
VKFSSTGSAPSEIFVLQHPSEIFNLAPPQKFRISDPFGKSRQQWGVDIKWNDPMTAQFLVCFPITETEYDLLYSSILLKES